MIEPVKNIYPDSQQYTKLGNYSLEDIHGRICWNRKTDPKKVQFGKYMVKMQSQRYKLFSKNHVCVKCGLKGEYYTLEYQTYSDNQNQPHFNLYGVKDGLEIMLTKDHIQPKSKEGKNNLKNYQTMCIICNQEKGNNVN